MCVFFVMDSGEIPPQVSHVGLRQTAELSILSYLILYTYILYYMSKFKDFIT